MPCTSSLAAIARENCPSRPGLKPKAWIAKTADLASIGAATNYEVATITAASGGGFYPVEFSRKDNNFNPKSNENGGYTTEVPLFIPRLDPAKSLVLNSMNKVEDFVLLVEDQNGKKRIVGSLEHPCMISVDEAVSPKNGYSVTATWEEHGDLPFFFTGSVPLHP